MMQLIAHSIRTSIVKRVKTCVRFPNDFVHTRMSEKMKICNLSTFNEIQIFWHTSHMGGIQCDCVHWTWVDSCTIHSNVLSINHPHVFLYFCWTMRNCNSAKAINIQNIQPVNKFMRNFSHFRKKCLEKGEKIEFSRNISSLNVSIESCRI